MIKRLVPMLVPLVLLIAAALLSPELNRPAIAKSFITPLLPLIIGLPTLILCLRFNRSRYFFSLFTVLLVYCLLQWLLPTLSSGIKAVSYQAIAILLPVNILIFSLIHERGMLTISGSGRFFLLVAQVLAIYVLYQFIPATITNILNIDIIHTNISGWTPLSQLSLFSSIIIILILNGRLFANPSTATALSFATLIGSLVILQFYPDSNVLISFSTAISLMFAIAIIQESHSMAYIDQLTNLPGRRALNEQLLKLGNKYVIAMLDIDKFKKFNDKYGHDIGDQVLRMVASNLTRIDSGGKAFRYGGEEFCVLFAGQDMKSVTPALERLRETIANSHFDLRKQNRRQTDRKRKSRSRNSVQVTISIGVAQRTNKLNTTQSVIKAADKALYRAKQKGRNRVCT